MKAIHKYSDYYLRTELWKPWNFFAYLVREIKYAFQRVFRGWDDCAWWSLDDYLAKIISELLYELRDRNHGFPVSVYDDDIVLGEETSEQTKDAKQKWQDILTTLADGFKEYYDLENCEIKTYEEELAALKKFQNEIMPLFAKWFPDLWD